MRRLLHAYNHDCFVGVYESIRPTAKLSSFLCLLEDLRPDYFSTGAYSLDPSINCCNNSERIASIGSSYLLFSKLLQLAFQCRTCPWPACSPKLRTLHVHRFLPCYYTVPLRAHPDSVLRRCSVWRSFRNRGERCCFCTFVLPMFSCLRFVVSVETFWLLSKYSCGFTVVFVFAQCVVDCLWRDLRLSLTIDGIYGLQSYVCTKRRSVGILIMHSIH